MLRRLHQLEDLLLAVLLMGMVGLAMLQIVLRNFFGSSLTWIDPLLQVSVLWLGLLGAAAATRSGRHIAIDVLEPVLKGRMKTLLGSFANAAAAAVCAMVAWQSYLFMQLEREFPAEAVLGLETWMLQTVIPFSFGLMALRFVLLALLPSTATKDAA